MELIQNAIGKGKSWIDESGDENETSFTEISQKLEEATSYILASYSRILDENKEDIASCSKVTALSTSEQRLQRVEQDVKDMKEKNEIGIRKCVSMTDFIETLQNNSRILEKQMATLKKEMFAKHELLCCMLAKRVRPLETLQDLFNRNLSTGTKLHKNIRQNYERPSRDTQTASEKVGFSSYFNYEDNRTITESFTSVLFNVGNYYNADTGEFIVPVDGIYLVLLKVYANETKRFKFVANLYSYKDDHETALITCYINNGPSIQQRHGYCNYSLIQLQAGDKLYVVSDITSVSIKASKMYANFSCFKLD
ncbi:uncharacterized protein LOC131932113 [Physella acuta]|uniref:uncharacterized protein LOC131932113 n=1 Tax=Physella acuta TaxID=109671 RepID=UPI0027DD941C|nr:uncharacterized protein LOC131932113 [Physella acuta]XP_059144985.1 uncharacterized protein LOC131932113 [Physella acuta]